MLVELELYALDMLALVAVVRERFVEFVVAV
jgi:hypothetical protein